MAGDYSKKVQSDNKHLANLTSARRVHIDGSKTQVIVSARACRLLRIVIFTKGINFIVRDGTDVIGNAATTTPEGTYDVGTYCNKNITVDVPSGTGSVLFVFGD